MRCSIGTRVFGAANSGLRGNALGGHHANGSGKSPARNRILPPCEMMLEQSPAGQPAEASSSKAATTLNVATQLINAQNFRDTCLLSRGWKNVAVANSAPTP